MPGAKKTKAQLVQEVAALRARLEQLKAAGAAPTDRFLQEWIQRYELVVAASGQIAYDYDVETGGIIWGATIENVLGYSMEEISGGFQQWVALLHPDDKEATLAYLKRAEAACSYWDAQYRMRHKDGHHVWIRDRGFFVAGAAGRVSRQLGMMEDITERKRAEQALQETYEQLERRVQERTAELISANLRMQAEIKQRESTEVALRENRDLLQAVMDGITDIIFTKDLQGRYCLVNAAIAGVLSRPPGEVIGRTSVAIFPPEEAARRRHEDQLVIGTKAPLHRGITMTVRGKPRAFLVSKMPHFDARGEVVGIIGIARDITEFKQTQERLQRAEHLASIGTLAAGIAHEINNPVGAIFLAAQNALLGLSEQRDPAELAKCLNDILEDAGRCGQIVKNVLRFAKEEPLDKEPADMSVVLRKAVAVVRPTAEDRGVSIDLALPARAPQVPMNTTAMIQAIENVIRNGIQAGEPGGRVCVKLECEEDLVRVTVQDDGCGLTADQQAHMFDPFFTSRRMEGGSGLGLSVVHGVVEDHGGTIDVESSPGQGTRVTLTLRTCR